MVDVGDRAPGFALKDQNNQLVSLAGFHGRRAVLLVFYPYAFTRVCGGELRAVQADLAAFQNDDVQILTVSVDTPYAHRVWAEQEGFGFPLLADFWPHGAVAQAYGCFDDAKGCATRGTYAIDKEGVVRWREVLTVPEARDVAAWRRVLGEL
ncbi:MAG TPA: peroxiredoxin [Frankiaceae bacterium]|nr:peroxiredoxin [Frankiaceae bacterium]